MSSRILWLFLKNYCKRTCFPTRHLGTISASNVQCASSYAVHDSKKSSSSESESAIYISRYLQPLMHHPIDKILAQVDKNSTTAAETVAILKALRMNVLFKGVNTAVFKTDKKYKILCEIFEKNCHRIDPNLLISGLRSLLEIGELSTAPWVVKAEANIIDNISSLTVFNLIGCLYYHRKYTETSLQKNLISLLTKEIHERINEVYSNSEILMLVHVVSVFEEESRKRLEQKITELIPILSIDEICKIFTILAENSNRNTVILNAASFYLRQREETLEVKAIIDLLYAFKKLNFVDAKLLQSLLNNLVLKIPSIHQPNIISSILTTCGSLRYKHQALLDACGKWITNNIETCRTKELAAYVLAIASLNYNTAETENCLRSILQYLTFEKVQSPEVWLDIIWSLAVINITDRKILQHVLSEKFYKPLIDGSDFKINNNKLKLMNLKTVLKLTYPECAFGCNLFLEPVQVLEATEIQNARKHVIKVLSNFVPKDKYLCFNLSTDMGIFIDAEFIMDKRMKPLSLLEYGIKAKRTNGKSLPEGSNRIALLVFFHKDYTLSSVSLTGSNALTVKLLSSLGYKIVQVPFSEFISNGTEVKKAKYLLQKIEDAVQKKMF
ncbi:FAST kinase domain-containing protein 4-like [Uloborus diversus]|uniref:FAST kinase domain-containing protein 4-like n=1 Tax=Uloborus diversus TaxID=327109 RepID=UPI00240A7C46|nr:FAST kinase domain-containing protein 4-like [Uloborus diversus]